ncbi:MAG: hypothetical protein JNL17_08695 [Cyclobacteriaceae bacterium]|nr:hypothetical protein [Cyclobacteriaceae bacterium]
MTKLILLATLAIFVVACGPSRSTSDESAADTLANESVVAGKSRSKINLDSLDWSNQATIDDLGEDINRAMVLLESGDSTIFLVANMQKDHRFFGYDRPSLQAERLLLFSIFTNDVENNPFECRLGSYYQTGDMQGQTLKYIGVEGDFIKAVALAQDGTKTTLYFEQKWISLE